MPRAPKPTEEEEVSTPEEEAEAIAEAAEETRLEELVAKALATEASKSEEEADTSEVDEGPAEPVLGGDDGEADGGSDDSVGTEGGGDEADDAESAEVEEAPEAASVAVPPASRWVDTRSKAQGGSTVNTN